VAALSLARSPGTPDVSFGSPADWPVAAGIAAVAYCFVHAGRRRSGQQRALLTGIGAGLVFGISDALTRRTVQIMDAHSFVTLFTSWPAYCVIVAGLIGLWLLESSFNAAPLHSSLPGITAAQPLTGILLGVLVFGDVIRISPGMLALQAAGLAAIVTGVILVARAPCLSALRPVASVPRLPVRHGHREPHEADQQPAPVAAVTVSATTGAVSPAPPVPPLGLRIIKRSAGLRQRVPVVSAPMRPGERPGSAAALLVRRLAVVAWILVAGYRAMMRRPDSLGEG